MIAVGAEITTIRVDNTTASAQTNVPVTFGQVFAEGDLPAAGAAVELRAPDNSVVQCQLDAKVNHADGSLRHGILSAIIPALAASASVTYSIVRKAAPAAGAAPVPADFAGLTATVLLTDTGTDLAGPNAGTAYTADAAAKLAAGIYETWLSGPIVSEWIVRAPLLTAGGVEHPDLHARFSIRAYAGQARAKIDYIVENNWAKPKTVPSGSTPWETVSTAPRIYAFSLKAGSNTVDTRAINGYIRARLTFNSNGVYDGNSTGVPNDATVYTATITVDGVAKPISVAGSAIQNYGQLFSVINSQLGGIATCVSAEGMLGIVVKSATTGPGSHVTIDYGTLFPALSHPVPYRPIRGDEYIHYPGTRWKKTFWWGAAPSVHIAHDKAYLIATQAVPNYPPDLTGDPAKIATNLTAMKANEDIGRHGITKAFMGDTGYAPGIGILPEWTAMYLVNQGADAKYIMLKQADLQGSWPVHAREYDTGQPISFEKWPYATWSPNAGDSLNSATGLNEKLPSLAIPSMIPGNHNAPDIAHHPDFCFVPYMVTGDHFYLEGLLFYLNYISLSGNAHATYRDGRKCLWQANQVRGQGWAIRTAAHALYITPTNHQLRSDIAYTVAQNVSWYSSKYVDPAGSLHNMFGHFWGLLYTKSGQANTGNAPWQDDFVTMSVGRAVELGFDEFLPLLMFKSKQIAGRLTSGTDFCWQLATAYSIRYRETSTSPQYTSWAEVYQKSFDVAITSQECGSTGMAAALDASESAVILQNGMTGYPALISGYPANMQPAIAYCATYATPGGDDAWLVFENRAQKPDYNLGPQFAIAPRTLSGAPPAAPDPTPDPPTTGITMTIADRVKDSTTTTGTGSLALNGAPPLNHVPFLTPPIQVGSAVPYAISHQTLNEWEHGFGTLTAALTLARTTVTASSNAGQKVNFSAGTKDVMCVLHASLVEMFARVDSPSTTAIANVATTSVILEEGGAPKRITIADFSAALGAVPSVFDAPFSTAIPFNKPGTAFMPQQSVAGALAFTVGADPVRGSQVYLRLVANGTNAPTFTGFKEWGGSLGYDNRNGIANQVQFFYDGIDYWYSISQAVGATTIDNVAPAITSAAVANATPSVVRLTMSEAIDSAYPCVASAFTIGGHTGSGNVAISGIYVDVTVTAPFVYGEAARTISYTQPGTNNLRDIAGNLLGTTGTPVAITNNLAAPATKPATMAAPTASAGQLSASLAFVAPANGGAAITGYTVTASTGQTATGTTSPISITMPAGAATFTITATNSVGTSDPSPASNQVTVSTAATAPATMAAPTATAGDTTASVVMAAPSDGGSPIAGYTVTSIPAGGVDANAGTTALTHNITGLINGTAYTFTATATNAVGTSAASPASNSVTPAAAPALANYPVLSSKDTTVTEAGTDQKTYTGTGGQAFAAQRGVFNKSLAAGVDGSLTIQILGVLTAANGVLIGVDTTSELQSYAAMNSYIFSGSTEYSRGGVGTTAGVTSACATGDFLRIRRQGDTITYEVARAATPAVFESVSIVTAAGALKYFHINMNGSGSFKVIDSAGLV